MTEWWGVAKSKGFGVQILMGLGAQSQSARQPRFQLSLHRKTAVGLTPAVSSLLSISETQQQLCIQLEFPRQENPEAVALRWDPVPVVPREWPVMCWHEGGTLLLLTNISRATAQSPLMSKVSMWPVKSGSRCLSMLSIPTLASAPVLPTGFQFLALVDLRAFAQAVPYPKCSLLPSPLPPSSPGKLSLILRSQLKCYHLRKAPLNPQI